MAVATSEADLSSWHYQKIAHEYYKDARKKTRTQWLNKQCKAGNALLYRFFILLSLSIDIVVF
jgi:hypothetical protein